MELFTNIQSILIPKEYKIQQYVGYKTYRNEITAEGRKSRYTPPKVSGTSRYCNQGILKTEGPRRKAAGLESVDKINKRKDFFPQFKLKRAMHARFGRTGRP